MRRVLIITFIICALASALPARADEGKSFKGCIKDFKAVIKEVRAYMTKYREEQKEIKLLAECIYWENWYTDSKKRAAYLTGAVVMNRVNSEEWPGTVKDVLYQKGQYSTTKYFFTQELPSEVYDLAKDIYYNGTDDVPANVVFQATFSQGKLFEKVNGEYFCYGR